MFMLNNYVGLCVGENARERERDRDKEREREREETSGRDRHRERELSVWGGCTHVLQRDSDCVCVRDSDCVCVKDSVCVCVCGCGGECVVQREEGWGVGWGGVFCLFARDE